MSTNESNAPSEESGKAPEPEAPRDRRAMAEPDSETVLRESDARLLMMADAIPHLAWMANADGYIHWFNRRWYDYTGTTPEAMAGWGWRSVHDPETLPDVLERWEASIESGNAFDMVFPLRGADGTFRRFLTRVQPLKDAEGRVLQWFGTNTDVEERQRAEASLRQNESLFATLIEEAPLGVYVVDGDFRIQQVNTLAIPVFEKVHPLIGRDFREVMEILWGPEVGGECVRIFRHTLETGERYVSKNFEHTRNDLGVEQAYDWEIRRMTLPDGRAGVVCYFSDVTERNRAEAALKEAKAAAEAANASKDRFLAILSHELRTPLTPVLMAACALEKDPDLRPEAREDMAMIRRNVELPGGLRLRGLEACRHRRRLR